MSLGQAAPLQFEERQLHMERLTSNWIVSSQYPFLTVENEDCMGLSQFPDNYFNLPDRRTIRNIAVLMKEGYLVKLHSITQSAHDKTTLRANAWSSKMYRRYMTVTAYVEDSKWCIQSTLIEFSRFMTAHKREATSAFLYDFIWNWGFTNTLSGVTTCSTSDMVKEI